MRLSCISNATLADFIDRLPWYCMKSPAPNRRLEKWRHRRGWGEWRWKTYNKLIYIQIKSRTIYIRADINISIMKMQTIQILSNNVSILEVLFKPVQWRVIKKLRSGAELNENEKRYLRGKLGEKLNVIDRLLESRDQHSCENIPLLEGMANYYITGFEALRHNGFGWFYDTKNIVIINTRIKGSLSQNGKRYVFIRVRSIKSREIQIDELTGRRYATNEQIYYDAKRQGDNALLGTWKSMLNRYGNMFVKHPEKFEKIGKDEALDSNIGEYGV